MHGLRPIGSWGLNFEDLITHTRLLIDIHVQEQRKILDGSLGFAAGVRILFTVVIPGSYYVCRRVSGREGERREREEAQGIGDRKGIYMYMCM